MNVTSAVISLILLSIVSHSVKTFSIRLKRTEEAPLLKAPIPPKKFASAEELYDYMERLRQYYELMSRPR